MPSYWSCSPRCLRKAWCEACPFRPIACGVGGLSGGLARKERYLLASACGPQGSTLLYFFGCMPWHCTTHGIPWNPHGIIAWHRIPWHALGGARHAMSGTMAPPAATATALYGSPAACHGNRHGTSVSTPRRFGLGFHGKRGGPRNVPWYAVENAVEGFAAGGATACHGMYVRKNTTRCMYTPYSLLRR